MAECPVQVEKLGGHDQSVWNRTTVTDEPIVTIAAIEHFVYCPRQCALNPLRRRVERQRAYGAGFASAPAG